MEDTIPKTDLHTYSISTLVELVLAWQRESHRHEVEARYWRERAEALSRN